jgi:hypothetical protein
MATAVTLLAAVAVALIASTPALPLSPPLYAGGGPPSFLTSASSLLGLDSLSRDVLVTVGAAVLAVGIGGFLLALRRAWVGHISLRRAIVVALVLHAIAVVVPVFLSRDVYIYTMYGRMISEHGANPYVDVPAAFATDPAYSRVSVNWIDASTIYGAGFTALSSGLTAVVSSPPRVVVAFKLLAAVASMATVFLAVAASRRVRPERACFAAILIGWNPLVIFHGVAGAHNDALVGLAVAAAGLALTVRRDLLATAALTMGVLIKASGAVPLLVGVSAAVIKEARGRRLSALTRHGVVALVVTVPFVVPFMQMANPTLGTLSLSAKGSLYAPSRLLMDAIGKIAPGVVGESVTAVLFVLIRLAFPLAFGWLLLVLLQQLRREPSRIDPAMVLGAIGWASLVSVMASPLLHPWHAIWLLPLCWVLPRAARGGAVLLSMALTLTELLPEPSPGASSLESMVGRLRWVTVPVILFVLIRILLDLLRRRLLMPRVGAPESILSEDPWLPYRALVEEGGERAVPTASERDGRRLPRTLRPDGSPRSPRPPDRGKG